MVQPLDMKAYINHCKVPNMFAAILLLIYHSELSIPSDAVMGDSVY